MSFNQIFFKKLLTEVTTTGGKELALSAATKTSVWYRPEGTEQLLKEPLEKAVKKAEKENPSLIPANTAELVVRESDHKSKADMRSHLTVVALDAKGQYIETLHLPTDKK
ncbi:hypothetical protein QBC37DRAFT_329293 [Rhypophila decipiens]|uniref:Uncharacterized protein n=1 Tax=Rhypophila decipiens TaxID=261697 RepID=A0AAN7B2R5_9PEZI|nr:hypothetical protein QBC37DRAFT_329293 [Rhypophila decipiens]